MAQHTRTVLTLLDVLPLPHAVQEDLLPLVTYRPPPPLIFLLEESHTAIYLSVQCSKCLQKVKFLLWGDGKRGSTKREIQEEMIALGHALRETRKPPLKVCEECKRGWIALREELLILVE
jgi:hypothetical protein